MDLFLSFPFDSNGGLAACAQYLAEKKEVRQQSAYMA